MRLFAGSLSALLPSKQRPPSSTLHQVSSRKVLVIQISVWFATSSYTASTVRFHGQHRRIAEASFFPGMHLVFFGVDTCGCTHLLAGHRRIIFACANSRSNGHPLANIASEIRRKVSRFPPDLTWKLMLVLTASINSWKSSVRDRLLLLILPG